MTYEEMITGLATEMLEKVANEVEENELEKEAGLKVNLKGVQGAAKTVASRLTPKGFKNAKANKELVEKTLGTTLDPHNPALKKYKKERNKLIAGGVAAGAGISGVGAGVAAMNKKKVQEKAASYFEEAEFLKQAAEEAYTEAVMMQDAAVALYNRMEEE